MCIAGTHAAPRLIDAPVIEDEEAEAAAILAQIEGDAVMEDDEANVAQGDGGADEDNDADEEELEEEELEEDEFDDEELDDEELDDDGDNHNYEDEDVFLGFSDQRTWFLAPMRAESITGESDLAWIQVKGYRPILGPSILHMGNKLRSYPLVRCYVFLRSAHTLDTVEEARWERLNNLKGHSLFLGLNHPIFMLPPPIDAEAAEPDFQLFKPDCVFATHNRARDTWIRPRPNWCRMHVNGGPAIGSRLQYKKEKIEHRAEAPMWFVPTLPPVFP